MGVAPTHYATCIAIGEKGVLLHGKSGSGKSDLALRLIDRGAMLVADDQIILNVVADQLFASSPPALCGLLEIRGIGIVRMPYVASIPVAVSIQLVDINQVERLPEANFFEYSGIRIPQFCLHAFDPSICSKITAALKYDRLCEG